MNLLPKVGTYRYRLHVTDEAYLYAGIYHIYHHVPVPVATGLTSRLLSFRDALSAVVMNSIPLGVTRFHSLAFAPKRRR